KFGTPPTRADYQYSSVAAGSGNQQVLVPMATPGTWYILVYGEAIAAPGAYTLQATATGIRLTGVTPDHAGNAADMTLSLTGAGFDRTTTVSLVASGGTTYAATTVSVDLPTQITATFQAGAAPAGIYSVRVANAAGASTSLSNSFTVIAGGQATLSTNV